MKKHRLTKVLAAVFATLTLTTMAFFAGCSNVAGGSYKFYKYTATEVGDDNTYYNAVDFKMNFTSNDEADFAYVKEIWVNLGSTDTTKNTEKITLKFYSSLSTTGFTSTSTSYFASKEIANLKSNVGKWIKISDSFNITSMSRCYFRIATLNYVSVNEIIVLDQNGNLVKFDSIINAGPVAVSNLSGQIPNANKDRDMKRAEKLFDAQDKFVKPSSAE